MTEFTKCVIHNPSDIPINNIFELGSHSLDPFLLITDTRETNDGPGRRSLWIIADVCNG